ncbi:MAG: hypothetical protein HUJ56_01885 [Erysipelotrichaceae bacterium]|nr:hypothetical protein [Erysipelotrichaceae bacterium]
MRGWIEVVDYEHDGDIRYTMNELLAIDPSVVLVDHRVYQEDPDADCPTCELIVEFDGKYYDQLKEIGLLC